MTREKLARLPIIFNANGDVTKDWFIEFYCQDPRSKKLRRQKIYKGINKYHTVAERNAAAEKVCAEYTEKLKSGWSPFIDEKIIWSDNLQYQTLARNYRRAKALNGTFNYYSSKYLDHIQQAVDPEGTLPTYRSKLRCFNEWLTSKDLHDVDVSYIEQPIVYDFFHFIINDLKRSAVTIKKYRQLLSGVFEFIRKERKTMINPCFDLPSTKRINDQKPQPVQEFDIQPFRDRIMAEDPQLWLAICFEYFCFLRPGKEVRLLKVGDIDFGRGIIRVSPVNSKTAERHISIPDPFMRIIRDDFKLHTYGRELFVFGNKRVPGPTPYGKNNLRFRFVKFRKAMNMPEMYKFYSWKHTGNVRAKRAGIPLYQIQSQNGHTSLLTTEKYMKEISGVYHDRIVADFPDFDKRLTR